MFRYNYEDIEDYNLNRKKFFHRVHDMIEDIMANKKFQAIIKELFIRCKKMSISLVFFTQSYFSVPKVDSTHYLIIKINNARDIRNIAIRQSANIDYKDFLKIYRECTKKTHFFLKIDTKLPARYSLRFIVFFFFFFFFDSYKNDSS